MTAAHQIAIGRVYDDPAKSRGARLLVDRVWPRGVSRSALQLDDWLPDVAPSTQLRKWFGHEEARWERFRERYLAELEEEPDALARCLEWCRRGPVVLLFAARDRERNQAAVLRDHLRALMEKEDAH